MGVLQTLHLANVAEGVLVLSNHFYLHCKRSFNKAIAVLDKPESRLSG